MEQGNTKHSARVDDSLADATEALTRGAPVDPRVEEWRSAEPAAESEPDGGAIIAHADPAPTGALDDSERRRRSELAMVLLPSAFPATRGALVEAARAEQAPDWVLDLLRQLPAGVTFATVQDVWTTSGGHREVRADAQAASAPGEDEARAGDDRNPAAPVPRLATEAAATTATDRHQAGPIDYVFGIASLGLELGSSAVTCVVGFARNVARRRG